MSADRPSGFGGKLRAARERRGVSLREIAGKTKISVGVLEALERNDFSRLPGGIFSRAFVRSYAVEVGLDPDDTIQEFLGQFPRDASVSAGHPRSAPVEDGEALESDRQMATTFLRLIAISIPLVGVVLYFSSGANRSGSAPSLQEPEAAAPVTPAPAPVKPAAQVPAEAAATGSGRPSAAVDIPTAPPAGAAAIAPRRPEPAAQPANASVELLRIDLSATAPCWISAVVDGSKPVERLLQPGDERTFEVRRELVLTAGDAAAISLKLNGVAARPLGKSGTVVTARVNLANFKEYLLPQ